MLYMDFGLEYPDVMAFPVGIYCSEYERVWFNDPVVVDISCKVDNLKHVEGDIFEHELTGRCSGLDISDGAKTVIMVYLGLADSAYPLHYFGENCLSVLGSLNINYNAVVNGDYVPMLDDWQCKFISKKTGNIIHNYDTYYAEWLAYGGD